MTSSKLVIEIVTVMFDDAGRYDTFKRCQPGISILHQERQDRHNDHLHIGQNNSCAKSNNDKNEN